MQRYLIPDGVVDHLDGLEVGLELDEVIEHLLGGGVEPGRAELVEILEPEPLERGADVLRLHLLEDILDFVHGARLAGLLHLVLQEAHEVGPHGRVDEDVTVESRVVVAFEDLDVADFGEVAERVDVVDQDLGLHLVLETLDQVDNVVDLVPDRDDVEELHKHARRVTAHILDLVGQLLLEAGPEDRDGHVGALGQHVRAVVRILQELNYDSLTDFSSPRFVQFFTCMYCCSVRNEDRSPRRMPSAYPLSIAKVVISIPTTILNKIL